MIKRLKRFIKSVLAKASIFACALWPSKMMLEVMRFINGIQLNSNELGEIVRALRKTRDCKLLVFGVGNDTAFWSHMNRHGATVFIEDNEEWLRLIQQRVRGLTAYLVSYKTTLDQADELLDSYEELQLDLPGDVKNIKWDVVLVDAPAGFNETNPGRMQSIATAARLAKELGDIFVHDCHRRVEKIYCDKILKNENFVSEIYHLRHYRAVNR